MMMQKTDSTSPSIVHMSIIICTLMMRDGPKIGSFYQSRQQQTDSLNLCFLQFSILRLSHSLLQLTLTGFTLSVCLSLWISCGLGAPLYPPLSRDRTCLPHTYRHTHTHNQPSVSGATMIGISSLVHHFPLGSEWKRCCQ